MTDNSDTQEVDGEPTGQTRVCQATGREQGLVGKYDIWLCRQAFREMAPAMGFEKHE